MNIPRLMIAAPKSGSGKTIITCGLLQLLKDRGLDVRSYKCGPDYIDPMFHRSVIGVPGGNLDTFFSSDEEIAAILSENACEAAVIEGVMGIYDGITGTPGRGSCYDVASATKTPVVLVMDVKGMGQTMLSLIKGILSDDSRCLIRGMVLNRISAHYYEEISPLVRELLSEISESRGVSVRLLGGIPDSKGIKLESRHLGLMMPEEISDLKDQVAAAAELINDHLDMDLLERIMDRAPELPDAGEEEKDIETAATLAVARDEAFCFYYEENLRMLKDCGIRLVEFSPLHDSCLPAGTDGLLLGGGYPELHAETLSSNRSMLESVKKAIEDGMPSLAECGGFMYLMEELEDKEGKTWPMAGVVKGRTFRTPGLKRFGYITVSGNEHASADSAETGDTLLSGLSVRGHEFHYYDSTSNGSDALAVKPGSGKSWECIHAGSEHIWGYPHLWYPSCPQLAERFREAMITYREKKDSNE